MNIGRRIVVYGPSGSGKSTFARELAATLKLPYIELDAVFHARPGWDDLSTDDFRAAVSALLEANPDGWVIDGNYITVADLILPHLDTAIWLRLPFRVVYPRLVRRTLQRVVTRELLWGTNRERWRDVLGKESMLAWGVTHWREHHRKTRAKMRNRPDGVGLVVLRTPAEVAELLDELRPVRDEHSATRESNEA